MVDNIRKLLEHLGMINGKMHVNYELSYLTVVIIIQMVKLAGKDN